MVIDIIKRHVRKVTTSLLYFIKNKFLIGYNCFICGEQLNQKLHVEDRKKIIKNIKYNTREF